jgi:hypothetical protein
MITETIAGDRIEGLIRASDPALAGGMRNESHELEDRACQWPTGSNERNALRIASARMADWIDEKAMASVLGETDARQGWDR